MFPYSRRSGTPAYDFPAQVHEREKQARSREMNARWPREIRREVLARMSAPRTRSCWKRPLRDAVHRLHPAVHPGGGLCPGHKSGEIVHVRLGEYDGERVRAALC